MIHIHHGCFSPKMLIHDLDEHWSTWWNFCTPMTWETSMTEQWLFKLLSFHSTACVFVCVSTIGLWLIPQYVGQYKCTNNQQPFILHHLYYCKIPICSWSRSYFNSYNHQLTINYQYVSTTSTEIQKMVDA